MLKTAGWSFNRGDGSFKMASKSGELLAGVDFEGILSVIVMMYLLSRMI